MVATPIGNLKDITVRAIEILGSVEYVACEDTRKTGFLLNQISTLYNKLTYYTVEKYSTKPKLISYYEQNEFKRIPEIINILKDNQNVALVSDAGTPTISDPGFKLVRECVKEGIKVESVPGPSSVISALVISGLPTDKFIFIGYPPKKQGHRLNLFKNLSVALKSAESTVIIFEAPHKILKTLEELKGTFGTINIVLARELTKVHEEIIRDSIDNAINLFKTRTPRGEFIILFNLKS